MKPILLSSFLILATLCSNAQSITEIPDNLKVTGYLLVNTPTFATNTVPTPAQNKTMINATTVVIGLSDSTSRIYDPGGPSGNYLANLTAYASVDASGGTVGIEVTVETMQLGTGDSLIIKERPWSTTNLLAVGNGYSTTGKWVFNSSGLYFIFKSNTDVTTGSGFSLLIKKVYPNSGTSVNVQGVVGNAMFFEPKTGAFRSGAITNSPRGQYSAAMGQYNTASGSYSTAFGEGTNAVGPRSTTMGYSTTASGFQSTASGNNTTASGTNSTSTGQLTNASGDNSTAMGFRTESRGYAGTAIGIFNDPVISTPQTAITATTPLFIIGNGDNATTLKNAMVVLKNGNIGIGTNSPASNLHIKHAAGGGLLLENANNANKWRIYSASGDNNLTFYNNAGTEIADIDDVTGAFNAVSDQRLKKNIEPVQAVLPLVMKLKPVSYQLNWQQSDGQRQIGLLAQDAYKLFPELVSYNKENDLYKMNYAGFSTVALKAIQELQVVIQSQQEQIEELKTNLLKERNEINDKIKKLETLICPHINL
jgi:Chaperone of endosialidase/Head domain of trimeric autotransporter adhesin